MEKVKKSFWVVEKFQFQKFSNEQKRGNKGMKKGKIDMTENYSFLWERQLIFQIDIHEKLLSCHFWTSYVKQFYRCYYL